MNRATGDAIKHTLHCLTGCSIGEILGSALGQHLNWPNAFQTMTAITLAFLFGYGLTFRGARKMGFNAHDASLTALRTDTISIASMELIDNALEWLIPGAMSAGVATWLFWESNASSLAVAFLFTVPVNRFVIRHSGGDHSQVHETENEGIDINRQ